MRNLLVLALFVFVFVGAVIGGIFWLKSGSGDAAAKPSLKDKWAVGSSSSQPARDFRFELPRIEGPTFRFAAQGTGYTLVNFWASWCEPCTREFPALLKLAQTSGDKLQIILISVDEDQLALENFLKNYSPPRDHPILLRDAASVVARRFGSAQLPETYLIGPDGQLVSEAIGFEQWDSAEVASHLRKLGVPL